MDDPVRRRGYEPADFRPLQNPFYVVLPYSDMFGGRLKYEAAKVVPWFIARVLREAGKTLVAKGCC